MPNPIVSSRLLGALIICGFVLSIFSLYTSYKNAPLTPKEWLAMRAHLEEVYNRKFGAGEVLELDGKIIHDCQFTSATLIYRGTKPYVWGNNSVSGQMIIKSVVGPAQSGLILPEFLNRSGCQAAAHCTFKGVDENLKPLPDFVE